MDPAEELGAMCESADGCDGSMSRGGLNEEWVKASEGSNGEHTRRDRNYS